MSTRPDPKAAHVLVALQREKSRHVTVMARLAGKPARFVVDTGAGGTVIDSAALARFGLALSGASRKGGGVGSSSMRLKYVDRHDLLLAGIDLSAIKLLSMDLSQVNVGLARDKVAPIVGVIGADVLWSCAAMLDYARGVMLLSPYTRSKRAR
jgi:Aspartyl protease